MDLSIINIAIGMSILMLSNLTLGSLNALFSGKFNKEKFWKGFGKSVVVGICIMATYYAGSLAPDILVMELNGNQVNLLTAIYALVVLAYAWYGKEVVMKITALIIPNKK